MAQANKKDTKYSSYLFFILRRKIASKGKSDDIFFVLHDSYKNKIFQDREFKNILEVCMRERQETSRDTNQKQDDQRIKIDCIDVYNCQEVDSCMLQSSDCIFNIITFKIYLMKFFGVDPYSCISYINNYGEKLSVRSRSDFMEFWKFAKLCSRDSKGVVLLVNFTNKRDLPVYTNVKDFVATLYDTISCSNNSVSDQYISVATEQKQMRNKSRNLTPKNDPYNYMTRCRPVNTIADEDIYFPTNEPITPAISIAASSTDIENVTHNINANTDEDKQNLDDVKLNNMDKINTSVNFNDSPPKWFKEYMDQLKQDIVADISRQVISTVMEYFNEQSKNSKEEWQYRNKKMNMRVENRESKQFINSVQIVAGQERTEELANDIKTTNMEQKKLSQYTTEARTNVNIPDIHNKVSANVNAVNKQTICPSKETFTSKEDTEEILHGKAASSSTSIGIENELRMNCSVTGRDILNAASTKDTSYCCEHDADNVSLCSNVSINSEVYETCNFEMIHMQQPKCITTANSKETFTLDKGNGSNDEQCSSFEILSEGSSSPSSINIDEHHFSADEENTSDSTVNIDFLSASKLNRMNCTTEKSRLFEDVKKSDNNSKQEAHNTSTMESDNGNFLSIPTQHNYQAQTDINDLTQSFHSHTASVTDNNNVYATNATCNSSNCDYSKDNMYDSDKLRNVKENRIILHIRKEFDNRNSKRNIKENGNIESPKRTSQKSSSSDLSEPVHILPETLVTGAIHVASLAYGTARGAFDKIRFNKEERSSHVKRGWH